MTSLLIWLKVVWVKNPVVSSEDKSLEEIISTYKDQWKGSGFSRPAGNGENIYKILAPINLKKASRNDSIPPKVVIRSAGILSKPLADVINALTTKGILPINAKLAGVKPR